MHVQGASKATSPQPQRPSGSGNGQSSGQRLNLKQWGHRAAVPSWQAHGSLCGCSLLHIPPNPCSCFPRREH